MTLAWLNSYKAVTDARPSDRYAVIAMITSSTHLLLDARVGEDTSLGRLADPTARAADSAAGDVSATQARHADAPLDTQDLAALTAAPQGTVSAEDFLDLPAAVTQFGPG